jgi:hypothetical protein
MWNTGQIINLFILYILHGMPEGESRFFRRKMGSIGVVLCGIWVPTLDLFMLKLCFGLLLHCF